MNDKVEKVRIDIPGIGQLDVRVFEDALAVSSPRVDAYVLAKVPAVFSPVTIPSVNRQVIVSAELWFYAPDHHERVKYPEHFLSENAWQADRRNRWCAYYAKDGKSRNGYITQLAYLGLITALSEKFTEMVDNGELQELRVAAKLVRCAKQVRELEARRVVLQTELDEVEQSLEQARGRLVEAL